MKNLLQTFKAQIVNNTNVLTLQQLGTLYDVNRRTMAGRLCYDHKDIFVEGKHFLKLKGTPLYSSRAILSLSPRCTTVTLVTEEGIRLFCNMFPSEKATTFLALLDAQEQENKTAVNIVDQRTVYSNEPVLTTAQLAEFYGCSKQQIRQNFNNNADHFIEGKHYFKLEGDTLDSLRVENIDMQISEKTRTLYLWTKRGAARHAKMLNTEKAWEVFEKLEDSYFAQVSQQQQPSLTKDSFEEILQQIAHTNEQLTTATLRLESMKQTVQELKVQRYQLYKQLNVILPEDQNLALRENDFLTVGQLYTLAGNKTTSVSDFYDVCVKSGAKLSGAFDRSRAIISKDDAVKVFKELGLSVNSLISAIQHNTVTLKSAIEHLQDLGYHSIDGKPLTAENLVQLLKASGISVKPGTVVQDSTISKDGFITLLSAVKS